MSSVEFCGRRSKRATGKKRQQVNLPTFTCTALRLALGILELASHLLDATGVEHKSINPQNEKLTTMRISGQKNSLYNGWVRM